MVRVWVVMGGCLAVLACRFDSSGVGEGGDATDSASTGTIMALASTSGTSTDAPQNSSSTSGGSDSASEGETGVVPGVCGDGQKDPGSSTAVANA